MFLEDYDIDLARMIIPGCDIWLNTPRRPYEASGTSGMKAAVNGVLNLSVLDGWWAEAYDPAYGWAIDGGSDEDDAEQLYALLEQQVVPRFRVAGRLARNDEELDRGARAAVLDAAHRDRVRRPVLRAGGARLARPRRSRSSASPRRGARSAPARSCSSLLEVLAVGLQPLDPLLAVRIPAEAAPAVMMMSSTHVTLTSFQFTLDNSYLMITNASRWRSSAGSCAG